ncbi:adenylate cyclase type 10 isoform X5 [Pan troglodytes]|uniref:adenylate cyclase type 10 isoform X5 n=1 Tax=Pan troglodytes TaxID=9598 RepID=UPI0030139C3E
MAQKFSTCLSDTVIGPKVSLAARMITAYPGLVSCDEVTYLRSMLPAYNFKKLPEKMMKNISNPGKIYEYRGHRRCIMFGKRHLARKRNKNHPLLGVLGAPCLSTDCEKELEAFQMAQQGCLHQKKGEAVLYEGGKGYGKSQLLAEINFLAQKEGHRRKRKTASGKPSQVSLASQSSTLVQLLKFVLQRDITWPLRANAMKSIMYSISPANSEEGQELYVCTVKDDVNLDTVLLPPFLKEIAVSQLDQLSPEEQLLVKCAAIIGHSFHIDLLQHLLPGWDKNKLLQVLRALVGIHVLCWSDKSQELPAEPILMPSSIDIIDGTKEKKTKLDGGSASLLRLQEELSLPQTEVLEFGVPLLRAAAWELWPKEQQIALHLECACFLQVLACRCGSCHGGDFVPFHHFAVCSTKNSKGTSRFCTYRDTGSVLTQVITEKLQLPSPQDSFQFQTKPSRTQEAFSSECCRTEEEFLDQVKRKLAQTSPEKDLLTTKPCHCKDILKLVLLPLTQHCLVLEETTCAFYYLLEAAAACLDLSDNYMVCFNMGRITLAKKLARKALRLLKRNFPWTWFGVLFQTFLEKYWHSCTLSQPPNDPSENKKNLAVLQQQVHCLSLLWQLYNREATASSYRFACLATLMQKNSADEFANEAQVVSTYVELSQFSQSVGIKDKWLHCEQMAIQKSSLCWFSREGLLATAQLMQALAYTKLCLGHLDFSIKLGLLCRPFSKCLRFVQVYEHSRVLTSQSNVMLGVHSSLAMWFAQESQWDLFEHYFSKACQLVKRTNASLFGAHGFVRFLECHVLMLQKMPEGIFMHIPLELRSQTLEYFKEFFSQCVTCPVYHQWVSELKASVMRCEKRELMSLTNSIRPFHTCLTRIWIKGEFLQENNS